MLITRFSSFGNGDEHTGFEFGKAFNQYRSAKFPELWHRVEQRVKLFVSNIPPFAIGKGLYVFFGTGTVKKGGNFKYHLAGSVKPVVTSFPSVSCANARI